MTEHEAERLASIAQLSLVEGEIIKEIQHLAEAAAFIAKTPMAFASLVGQHSLDFVANVGMPNVESIPRDTSFCEHLQSGEPRLVITDAMMDQRFIDAPLVNGPPFLRAYAGHMIEAAPGQPAGALCVVDTHPRAFEPPVLKQLGHLAEVASHILCARNAGSDLAPSSETTDRDPLTDLLNQAAFRARVNDTLHNTQSAYTLALIDVDHFKYINDHLGHTFGDQFLIQLSKAVSATLGQDAIVGRIGGDEFAALLPPQPVSECEKRIEAMRLRIRRTAVDLGQSQLGRVSVGLSRCPADVPVTYEQLYQRADIALCAAKDSGRNKATLYTQDLDALYNLRAQRAAFASALANGQIEPFFQPKIDLLSGQIVSFELLVRWRDPDRGVIEPAAFQKILTDRAAAPELTYHMLSAAIDAHKEWRNQNAPDIRFAVNLTVHDLSDVQFVDDLDWRIREAGLNWADFTFEVTESVVMGNPDGSVYSSMERIREKGGEVSLDDFGTGFAGLAHLRDWPIDSVKIDREFVKGMTCNPKDDMIVASIISLAHRLDLEVIAEGIETEEVARRLTQMGCDRGQGYHFSRPVDRENAFSILCENRLEQDAGRAPYFAER